MKQGITFLQDFKLGHYMKILTRAMFKTQVGGTIVAALAHLATENCFQQAAPGLGLVIMYFVMLIGPRRIFADLRYWFFLVGAIAPILVWIASKAFPNKPWIKLINMHVLFGATVNMSPATTVNYTSWILIGFASGFIAYRYYHGWWSRHNYVLSGALETGLAFMGVLLYLCLGMEHVSLSWWGGGSDKCLLAQGIIVKGYPIL